MGACEAASWPDPEPDVGWDLRSLAATARRTFPAGTRMKVRGSRVVHAVTLERWVADLLAPHPLCRTAVYGWAPSAYQPTRRPVTCLKCVRALAKAEGMELPHGMVQPPLFLLPREEWCL